MSTVTVEWSIDGDRKRSFEFDPNDYGLDGESDEDNVRSALLAAVDDEYANEATYGISDLEGSVLAVLEALKES